jgi:hypothetical protein
MANEFWSGLTPSSREWYVDQQARDGIYVLGEFDPYEPTEPVWVNAAGQRLDYWGQPIAGVLASMPAQPNLDGQGVKIGAVALVGLLALFELSG